MTSRNAAAVLEMDGETPKKIAHELVTAVRSRATIDWNLTDSVKAAMRSKICLAAREVRLPAGPQGNGDRAGVAEAS
ncbi:type I restriction enzyme endonuclease domain-containing protein [Mycobacterium sp. 852014-50255_SCH5639931]|uniref:type I restriction enzyme endonuclease domain-containing protein n=1 Tax=Mycobacterium sp. 852014-50255_SCH5639931 TaxID=1834112 RepID=UPI000B2F6A93|nr:type I restriction enzyme endonuclease domain-containing protein [Mycobacterium sp. 852014-50255_SCH5639931]